MLKCLGLIVVLSLVWQTPALGHKLLVVAWLQGNQLMVEVAFGDGSLGNRMAVTVLDADQKEILLEAETDAEGFLELTLPEAVLMAERPLLVRANDGAGHQAEQRLEVDEIRLARPLFQAEAFDVITNPVEPPAPLTAIPRDAGLIPQPDQEQMIHQITDQITNQITNQITQQIQDQIRPLIQEAVRQELAPLRRDLRAMQHSKPGMTEILGGIGYIIGLASLATLLLHYRRRKSEAQRS